MTQSKWIDISQPLTNDMANWPGDRPFNYSHTYTKDETGSVNVGEIIASLHAGTHIDAPYHFDDAGRTVDELDVNLYAGKAKILDVSHTDTITAETLTPFNLEGVKRVLLHTSLPNNPKTFPEHMPELDPSIAEFLSDKGVQLIGVDLPSVDPPESEDLAVHLALYKHDILILENVMLDHVTPDVYEFMALPLRLNGADGSPVRAVLKPVD